MAYRVRWTRHALDDLAALRQYISRDSKVYAARFAQRLLATGGELKDFPLRGRLVPELNREDIREVFIGQYRLIYRVKDTDVEILTLIHGSRDLKP